MARSRKRAWATAYRLVYEDSAVRVYENMRAYPRAYFVPTAHRAPNDAETLAIVTSPGFDGRRDALVEGATTLPPRHPADRMASRSRSATTRPTVWNCAPTRACRACSS